MTGNGQTRTSNGEDAFERVLADFLDALARGEPVDLPAWQARYPAFAADLAELCAARQEIPGALRADETVPESPSRRKASPRPAAGDNGLGVLGDYELLEELGQGGMGRVYKARQRSLGRLVALKVIRVDGPATEVDRLRFRTEAEAAARLDHPNIVPVYEVGEHEGQPYLAIRYVEGGSLNRHLDRFRDDPRAAVTLVEALARAVHHAHERGVLHRDLKPGNVLVEAVRGQGSGDSKNNSPSLTPDPWSVTPLITDFGLARLVDRDCGLTRSGDLVGTPSYMAPEQASRGGAAITTAADIYGLGAILYALLTGRPPFVGETILDTLEQVKDCEPEPPSRLNPKISRDLQTVCLKCLHKEPARRYASAWDLAEDLRRLQMQEPISARPVSSRERLALWAKRRPAMAAVYGLMGLVLLLGGVGGNATWLWQRSEAARTKLASEAADALAAKQAQTEAALATARRQSSLLSLERGLTSCEQGEEAAGLLWFARSLTQAPEGTEDLQRAIRGCISSTARRLRPLAAMVSHQGIINAVAFSPDQQLFATASSDRSAQLWETRTGRPHGPPLRHPGRVWALAFSPDGRQLLTGSADQTARFWDVRTGKLLEPALVHAGEVRAVAFSPDGKRVLTGSTDKTARLWDKATGRPVAVPLLHRNVVKAVAFSPDGRRILTGSWDGTAQQWEARTCRPLGPPLQHQNWVNAVAFSPDSKVLLTGSDDHTARLWEAETGKPLGRPLPHHGGVFAAVFSPDGRLVLTGSGDHNARVWETRSGRLLGAPLLHPAFVRAAAFSPDGQSIVTGCDDQAARVWEAAPGEVTRSPLQHDAEVFRLVFHADGHTLLTASADRTVRCWEATTGRQLGSPLQMSAGVEVVGFSSDGKAFVEGCKNRTVRLWDVAKGKPVNTILLPDVLHAVAFSPDGSTLVMACEDASVVRWRPGVSEPLRRLLQLPELVHALAISPDARMFATAGEDHTARLWDLSTAEPLGPPLNHQGEVYAVAFSPNGRMLVTGSGDRMARLWEVKTGQTLGVPLQHGDAVWAVAFSPDGKTVLSGGGDKNARLWDVASCQPLAPPFRHESDVRAVAFSPDGRTVLTGGLGQTARLWEIYPPMEGDPEGIALGASVLTGMDLSDANALGRLDAETWSKRWALTR
jgi:WD40 repeat protein/serine/threonine protein kinase